MTKSLKRGILAALVLAFAFCLGLGGALAVHAEGTVVADYSFDVTVTSRRGGQVVQSLNAVSDPYSNTDVSASGHITGNTWTEKTVSATQTVVYTAAWRYSTSRRTGNFREYRVVADGNGYKIDSVTETASAGSTNIPAGGFVVSVPAGTDFGAAGDSVTITAKPKTTPLQNFRIPTMAVEDDEGNRIAIDNLNVNRSGPMVVYYDSQQGDKTGTNVMGTEMSAKYDEEENAFIVQEFRDLYEGDDSGMTIPENGFVLSAYGEGYRGILQKDARFSVGDKLSIVGFDYIRFGGEVTYMFNFINPTLEENPGIDPATNKPFPAYRGTNQLIVYKDGWSFEGKEGTGTNVYGFEVAVNEHGVVVERAVNVSKIPAGGYVLSGHGTGRDFLQANVPMGATVVLDETNKTFTATTSLNSYYTNVATALSDAVETAQDRIAQLYDLNRTVLDPLLKEATTACDSLEALKDEIVANDPQGAERNRKLMRFNVLKLQVEKLTRNIISASAESKPVAGRAVWHRPTEKNLAALQATIGTYKECGINLVFVESFYGGMSLFRSDLVPYHVDFANCSYGDYPDYLTAFAAEAEKEGIEVHAWVEDFYVGVSETQGLYKDHKDWVLYNDDDTILQRNEGGPYIFLDPANKAVQDLLISYYKELLEKVPGVKGLNLDYIRYPVSPRSADVGFTEAALTEFAAKQGITLDGATRAARSKSLQNMMKEYKPGGNALYTAWVEYRTSKVTEFVKRVVDEVKGESDLLLSTAVFPSVSESMEQKKQDWQTWLKNGWIDIATPMAYYDSPTDVLQYVRTMINFAGDTCYYYAGLASSYRGLPAYTNAEQVNASYSAGAQGYVIFCSTQILGHDDVQTVLKSGVNSSAAVLPHADLSAVLEACFGAIEDRATRLYIPEDAMAQADLEELEAEFAKIRGTDASDTAGLRAVYTALTTLYNKTRNKSGFAWARISETLNDALSVVRVKLTRVIIAESGTDPGKTDPPVDPGETDPPVDPGKTDPPAAEKKGCGGVVGTSAAVAVVFTALAAVTVAKKKRN